jgi:hypothetical protein
VYGWLLIVFSNRMLLVYSAAVPAFFSSKEDATRFGSLVIGLPCAVIVPSSSTGRMRSYKMIIVCACSVSVRGFVTFEVVSMSFLLFGAL